MTPPSKYPNIEKLGLKVEFNNYGHFVYASELEAVLSKADEVLVWYDSRGTMASTMLEIPHATHSALLIAITPLKPKCERHEAIIYLNRIACKNCGSYLSTEWKEAGEV